MLKPVICLMGPTAAGKTAHALELVQRFPVEIISVDSGMIYREMDIGTAKPTLAEQAIAPHHLIDIIDPPETFSAAEFCKQANLHIAAIHQAGKFPLLVGGTMMYFNALQTGLSLLPEANQEIRAQLLERAQQFGWPVLYAELMKIDPISASRIHANDTQRIQRALEVFYLTETPLSVLQNQVTEKQAYHFENIILFPENRAWLHERIAARFALMLSQGFIAEVEHLLAKWPLTLASPALRCVGYRQAYEYLQGEYDYDLFIEKAHAATRQLAKRQLTWLRHWSSGHFIDVACGRIELVHNELVVLFQEILDNN